MAEGGNIEERFVNNKFKKLPLDIFSTLCYSVLSTQRCGVLKIEKEEKYETDRTKKEGAAQCG